MNAAEKKRLKATMEHRIVNVPMSHAEVLLLHALGVFGDGRHLLTKIIRKRIRPVALNILKTNKEY